MNKYVLLMLTALLPLDSNAWWYGGINLGVNSVEIKKDLLYPLGDQNPTTANSRTNYTNAHGQLLWGYAFSLNDKFGTAIEANADAFAGKSEQKINNWFLSDNALAQERLDYGLSLFLLPSYQLNQYTQLFVGPGISGSRFAIKSGTTAGNVGVSGAFKKWLTGGSLKAGIATQINEYADVVLSYQYTMYDSVTWENIEPLSEDSLRGHYRPSVNTVMIGIKSRLPEFKKIKDK